MFFPRSETVIMPVSGDIANMTVQSYDALVIGAGFSGIYQLYSLLKLGLNVKLLEKAESLGGTWHWNRYPGAMSDVYSHMYRYSWDKEDALTYAWTDNYLDAKDVLVYLEHVSDRHDLRKHMQFDTEVQSATWEDASYAWTVKTSQGTFNTRYLVLAVGFLSEPNWPNIPGREKFMGEMYHTSRWPENCDLKDKRVGVIGNGSTGVQLISTIAKDVKSLILFQRHAQYTVPASRRPVTKEEREKINSTYDETWELARNSRSGSGFVETTTAAMSVSEEERRQVYQAAWDDGGSMRFFLTTFSDLMIDETANRTACDFVKEKIAEIVRDPEKRRKLMPKELYVRRPLCDSGFYEAFNRESVDVEEIQDNPFAEFTTNGIKMSDGTIHELDIMICATGLHAFDGAYRKIHFEGRDGITLTEHWKDGPTTNMGVALAAFPNMMMVLGPKSPLANVPPMIEAHVEFITNAIARAEKHRTGSSNKIAIESTKEGEDEWTALCDAINEMLLFKRGESYLVGANIEGKKRGVYVFMGGLAMFRQKLQECADSGYNSFHEF